MDQLSELSTAWKGHELFALWLVSFLNPKVTVDLGVDYGYSTFVLAKKNTGIVYGIDSFEGDAIIGVTLGAGGIMHAYTLDIPGSALLYIEVQPAVGTVLPLVEFT